MSSFIALHQFEIRYTHILDFSSSSKPIISPFVKLAQKLGIDNEGSLNEKISLTFEEEGYTIQIHADRILIRYQGLDDQFLTKNNSPVESVFFLILNKIKALPSFGNINNYLAYSLLVDVNDNSDEANLEYYKTKYLSKSHPIPKPYNDLAITFANYEEGKEYHLTIGPYKGKSDLISRGVVISKNLDEIVEKKGLMTEIKLFYPISDFTFSDYKIKIINHINDIKKKAHADVSN